jgi:uncharacterized protein (TIGR03067 family)
VYAAVSLLGLILASDDAERLIQQLGSPDFAQREAATQRLKVLGEPALDALRKAASSDDAEVRRRAKGLIEDIENLDYERLQGTWDCTTEDGPRLVVRGGRAMFQRAATTTLAFRLATRENPRAIDFLQQGQIVLVGIYAVKGDELDLCLPIRQDRKRPSAFAETADKEFITFRFKRARPQP